MRQSVMTGETRGRDRMGSEEVRQTGGDSQSDSTRDRFSCGEVVKQVGRGDGGLEVDLTSPS